MRIVCKTSLERPVAPGTYGWIYIDLLKRCLGGAFGLRKIFVLETLLTLALEAPPDGTQGLLTGFPPCSS